MTENLYCPRCYCDQLVRLDENDISPYPGYRCLGCQRRLRDRGSMALYLVALAISTCILLAILESITFQTSRNAWLIILIFTIGFLYLIGYIVFELTRPTPRKRKFILKNGDPSWYVARNGHKTGPWALSELQHQARKAKLSPNDMLLPRDGNVWISAAHVNGLFDLPIKQ